MVQWLQSLNISDVIAWVSAALGTYATWFARNAQVAIDEATTALDTVKTESDTAVAALKIELAKLKTDLDQLQELNDKSNKK